MKAEVITIPPPPETGITIEFMHSTSGSFEFAVQAAEKHPTFEQFGRDKKAVYRINVLPSQLDTAMEVVEYVKGWRRRAVYVDGVKVPWKQVFQFTWCYERRQASFKPEFFCFGYEDTYRLNPWGCIQANMPFQERAEWCTWGRWLNKRGDWQFDKARMKHELQKQLYAYRFCPVLDFALVEQTLAAFPERVNPKKDKDWKFVETWDDTVPGLVITVTTYGIEEKTVMVGAAPQGMGALQQLVQAVRGLRLPVTAGP